jgi:hypothetical protein
VIYSLKRLKRKVNNTKKEREAEEKKRTEEIERINVYHLSAAGSGHKC